GRVRGRQGQRNGVVDRHEAQRPSGHGSGDQGQNQSQRQQRGQNFFHGISSRTDLRFEYTRFSAAPQGMRKKPWYFPAGRGIILILWNMYARKRNDYSQQSLRAVRRLGPLQAGGPPIYRGQLL